MCTPLKVFMMSRVPCSVSLSLANSPLSRGNHEPPSDFNQVSQTIRFHRFNNLPGSPTASTFRLIYPPAWLLWNLGILLGSLIRESRTISSGPSVAKAIPGFEFHSTRHSPNAKGTIRGKHEAVNKFLRQMTQNRLFATARRLFVSSEHYAWSTLQHKLHNKINVRACYVPL
jgi:hypothetical protein